MVSIIISAIITSVLALISSVFSTVSSYKLNNSIKKIELNKFRSSFITSHINDLNGICLKFRRIDKEIYSSQSDWDKYRDELINKTNECYRTSKEIFKEHYLLLDKVEKNALKQQQERIDSLINNLREKSSSESIHNGNVDELIIQILKQESDWSTQIEETYKKEIEKYSEIIYKFMENESIS